MGMLRPDIKHPKRNIFNYAHRSIGMLLLLLSGFILNNFNSKNESLIIFILSCNNLFGC